MALRYILTVLGIIFLTLVLVPVSFAQSSRFDNFVASDSAVLATESAGLATSSAQVQLLHQIPNHDFTQPEETQEKKDFLALFSKRQIKSVTPLNIIAFMVQQSVISGVPANTIILILLLPFLATMIVFTRQILGFPSLEMLVPIALSITLVSTGITAGAVLLLTILLASTLARLILKKVRVMQLPKMSMSMLLVSFFVFICLSVSASAGILSVKQISIFPILLLILLSEKIVTLQLTRSFRETVVITTVTLWLGIIGYFFMTSDNIRQALILYPEVILVLIPINILIGRYFGLRLTEFFRFSNLRAHAN